MSDHQTRPSSDAHDHFGALNGVALIPARGNFQHSCFSTPSSQRPAKYWSSVLVWMCLAIPAKAIILSALQVKLHCVYLSTIQDHKGRPISCFLKYFDPLERLFGNLFEKVSQATRWYHSQNTSVLVKCKVRLGSSLSCNAQPRCISGIAPKLTW